MDGGVRHCYRVWSDPSLTVVTVNTDDESETNASASPGSSLVSNVHPDDVHRAQQAVAEAQAAARAQATAEATAQGWLLAKPPKAEPLLCAQKTGAPPPAHGAAPGLTSALLAGGATRVNDERCK